MKVPAVNDLLRATYAQPGGKWLIAKLIGRTAPYSGSIKPQVLALGSGHARLRMRDHRAVRNHLNSIHACALSTLTETTVGLSVLYTLPNTARGIATELSVVFHAKARGPITAECHWDVPDLDTTSEFDIEVPMQDAKGVLVATGSVRFRISPARR